MTDGKSQVSLHIPLNVKVAVVLAGGGRMEGTCIHTRWVTRRKEKSSQKSKKNLKNPLILRSLEERNTGTEGNDCASRHKKDKSRILSNMHTFQ